MAPHDELAHGGTQYVLAKPGVSYIAYTTDAAGGVGLRDLVAGRYALRWFDCATGRAVEQAGISASGDTRWPCPAGIGPNVAVSVRLEGKK